MSSNTPSDDAEEPVKCKRCNGTGAIKTGEIDCYPDGTPYMNGPVICVEDCPDCHPPKPAESEAEIIETLKAENFKLASGQCTEGGPWGDEGGTPYCKYAARKPMTAKEMLKGIDADTYPYEEVLAFVTGIRYAEKHHGIGGGDE